MNNDSELCVVNLSNGLLDNDYTFYKDGRILHFYDRHSFSLNNEEWLKPSDINQDTKEKILAKCPNEHIDTVRKILG